MNNKISKLVSTLMLSGALVMGVNGCANNFISKRAALKQANASLVTGDTGVLDSRLADNVLSAEERNEPDFNPEHYFGADGVAAIKTAQDKWDDKNNPFDAAYLNDKLDAVLCKQNDEVVYLLRFNQDIKRENASGSKTTYAFAGSYLAPKGKLLVLPATEESILGMARPSKSTPSSDVITPEQKAAQEEATAKAQESLENLLGSNAESRTTLEGRESPYWTKEEVSLYGVDRLLLGSVLELSKGSKVSFDAETVYVTYLDENGDAQEDSYSLVQDGGTKVNHLRNNVRWFNLARVSPLNAQYVQKAQDELEAREQAIRDANINWSDAYATWSLADLETALDENGAGDNARNAYQSIRYSVQHNKKVKEALASHPGSYFVVRPLRDLETTGETGMYLFGVVGSDGFTITEATRTMFGPNKQGLVDLFGLFSQEQTEEDN